MKIAVIAITKNGCELAVEISKKLDVTLFLKKEYVNYNLKFNSIISPFSKNMPMLFDQFDGIVFIMATGIVIRSIAPHIVSKLKDPAIVVMDERANYVISLLSGHIGGANELAIKISNITDAIPVITTATDVNKKPAADMIAKTNNCYIENIEQLKYINSAFVNGKQIALFTEHNTINQKTDSVILNPKSTYRYNISISNIVYKYEDCTLYLRPKILVLGVGCKKNIPYDRFENAVKSFMHEIGRSIYGISTVSSIDIKSKESCILKFCQNYNLEYVTFSSDELKSVESKFEQSKFVKSMVGVGNVCETSAYLASKNSKQLSSKRVYDGITLCLFENEYKITI